MSEISPRQKIKASLSKGLGCPLEDKCALGLKCKMLLYCVLLLELNLN